MDSNISKVSIVITNFNRIDDLKETLFRSEDITYQNLELIIVDNGSSDGSKEYILNLPSDKYKTFIIENNMGCAYAHSLGMKNATGDYIITIDDDCFLSPGVVDNTVKIFDYHQNLAAIGYGFLNPNIDFDMQQYKSKIDFELKKNQYINSYESAAATSGAAFRKSVLEEIGYYDLNWFYIGEDVELCMSIIANGYNTVQISELVAYHKSSPVNRNFDQIAILGIKSSIWLKVKYYPLPLMIASLFSIIVRSIYYSIIYRNMIYIKAIISSTKKINYVWANRKVIDSKIVKSLVTADSILFTR